MSPSAFSQAVTNAEPNHCMNQLFEWEIQREMSYIDYLNGLIITI